MLSDLLELSAFFSEKIITFVADLTARSGSRSVGFANPAERAKQN
jgi:hypothetical protein